MEEVDLSLDSILAEAREKAGLQDFGDESFLEATGVLLRSLDQEARLNPVGRMGQRFRIVDLLVNCLRVQDFFQRYPEIAEEVIEAPFFIVGLPRTGTTMLHRLISSDPAILAADWWECRNPAPFPEEGSDGKESRIANAEEQVRMMLEGSPELASIHPLEAQAPDEEIMLLEHSFYSTTPESGAYVPSYIAWQESHDQTPGYLYLKKLLQFLQWQKKQRGEPGVRWALKTPHHLGFLDVLFKVFPDARIICTHRDPLQTIPSLASMIHAIWILSSDDVDALEVGRQWGRKMKNALDRCMAVRDEMGSDRFIDLNYQDTMADPMAQVRRIYEFLELELSAQAAEAMQNWLAGNRRDQRAAHEYTLEQFGYTQEGLEKDFAEYRRRFIP